MSNDSTYYLIKAAYRWLAFEDEWGACLAWNLGIAGMCAYAACLEAK